MDDIYERANSSWTHIEMKTYGIERKERRICFGNPGYVDDWIYAGSFDTEEERDKELNRLNQHINLDVHWPNGSFKLLPTIEYRAVTNQPTMVFFR